MANETRYGQVNQFIPDIWEAVLMYLDANFVMPSLVTTFTARGWMNRNVTEYQEGSVTQNLGELQDLTPTLLERDLLAQLVPFETGVQYLLTDRRIEGDDTDVIADVARKIGYEMGKSMEANLLGDLARVTGGTVGTANAALTWADIYGARARLAANNVPGPYSVVLHEYQWLDLATAANIAGTGSAAANNAALRIRDEIQSRYYVGSISDMNFYTSTLVPIDGNDDATGGMFGRSAIALDLRRGLRIEPERDASLRATEWNATMVYAHGLWRPTHGVRIISDATASGSNVTTNTDIAVLATIDDTTAATGQDLEYTVIIVNESQVIAKDILLTMTIPNNFTYMSDVPSQGVYNSTAKTWAAGSLAPGQAATLRLNLDATSNGAGLNIIATLTSVTPADNVAGNNAATVTVTIA